MGRHKQHKRRRSRAGADQSATHWFGTAFHSTEGMHHLDVRPSGNGILITSSPAEVDGAPAAWSLCLRNVDDGRGLDALGAAFEGGQPYGIAMEAGPGFETVLLFIPNEPEDGVGTLTRVRSAGGTEAEVAFERRAERPMPLWAEAGQHLRRIVPGLGPEAPPADEPENSQMCPGCHRPVYEGSSSHTLIGAGASPVFGLCRLCADGSTLRSLCEAGVSVPPPQRALLEAAAGAPV